MECDIHVHIEIKINNKWEHYSSPDIPRNYALFERMAGVRGDISKAIMPPRGIPADAHIITKAEARRWMSDAHSLLWLDSTQFKELMRLVKNDAFVNAHQGSGTPYNSMEWGYISGTTWEYFTIESDSIPAEFEDFRVIFWFDN